MKFKPRFLLIFALVAFIFIFASGVKAQQSQPTRGNLPFLLASVNILLGRLAALADELSDAVKALSTDSVSSVPTPFRLPVTPLQPLLQPASQPITGVKNLPTTQDSVSPIVEVTVPPSSVGQLLITDWPVLSNGMSGAAVVQAQLCLLGAGDYGELDKYGATGYLGDVTTREIQTFQTVTGIANGGTEDTNGFGQIGKVTEYELKKRCDFKDGTTILITQNSQSPPPLHYYGGIFCPGCPPFVMPTPLPVEGAFCRQFGGSISVPLCGGSCPGNAICKPVTAGGETECDCVEPATTSGLSARGQLSVQPQPTATTEIIDKLEEDPGAPFLLSKELKLGDHNDQVLMLNGWLYDLGLLKSSFSSIFDSATESAVNDFQKMNGLIPTGFVDKLTGAALNNHIRGSYPVEFPQFPPSYVDEEQTDPLQLESQIFPYFLTAPQIQTIFKNHTLVPGEMPYCTHRHDWSVCKGYTKHGFACQRQGNYCVVGDETGSSLQTDVNPF